MNINGGRERDTYQDRYMNMTYISLRGGRGNGGGDDGGAVFDGHSWQRKYNRVSEKDRERNGTDGDEKVKVKVKCENETLTLVF